MVELFRKLQTQWDQRRIETRTISWDPLATYARLEWRLRGVPFLFTIGVVFTIIVTVGIISLLTSPQAFSRTLLDLASGLPAVLFLHVIVAGLFGFLTPFLNDESIPSQNSIELAEVKQRTGMGEFRACLPISDAAMANATIWSIGKCLLISLGLLLTFSVFVFWLVGWSNVNGELRPSMQGKLPVLAITGVIASWAAMSGGTALGYFSIRHSKLPLILVGIFTGLIVVPTVTARLVPAILLVAMAIVVYHFASAYRKRLLSAKRMLASGFCLAVLAFWGWLILPSSLDMSPYLLWFLLPLAAIWPVASLPLAIQACRRG